MTLPWRLLGVLCAAIAMLGAGYRWGGAAADGRHAAQELQLARAATSKLLREIERGNAVQTALDESLQAQASTYSTLERQFNDLRSRVRFVVRRDGAAVGGLSAAPRIADASRDAGGTSSGPLGPLRSAVDDRADLVLSAAALWMWNSALAGTDTPAGACGSVDTSDAACAVGTAVTLDAASSNQRENARICADNRVRHSALIDFILKGKPQ